MAAVVIVRGKLLFICICAVSVLCQTASADLMIPTITHVYFEKDGGPLHGSADYTVTCYGYRNPGWPHGYTTLAPGSYEPYEVYRYSASCPDYGCTVFEPYYYKPNIIDRCDLKVTVGSSVYTIHNFSTLPYTHCTHLPIPEVLYPNRTGGVFYYTPEYMNCRAFYYYTNRTGRNWTIERRVFVTCDPGSEPGCISLFPHIQPVRETLVNRSQFADPPWALMNDRDLLKYLDTCNPVSEPSCGGWTVDGTPAKKIPGLRPYSDATSPRDHPCDTFLIQPGPDLMVPKEIVTSSYWDNEYLAADACELRITIPSGNGEPVKPSVHSPETTVSTTQLHTIPATKVPEENDVPAREKIRSPVESLYCSIVEFLGGRCE
ncbi:MAG: hypothetical protein Q7V05_12905 [Methanoregula sp.]|nr:hypothetical protein [Methanoregula sp.]